MNAQDPASQLWGSARARPVRVAYLVDRGRHGQSALDGIFADAYGRWAGRFSLIVPCLDGRPAIEYWPWLEVFDPDIVYCYGSLADEELRRIHDSLSPSEVIFHDMTAEAEAGARFFRPNFGFNPLSSPSVLFSQARLAPKSLGSNGTRILTSWHTEKPSRFFQDNFGSYFQSMGTSVFPVDAKPTAELLTVLSAESLANPRLGIPKDLSSVAGEMEAFAAFASQKAGSMSLLSCIGSSRTEVRDWRWSQAFHLVVGETFDDRVLFWNSRLLTPAWLDEDLCCFRLTLEQVEDETFLTTLIEMLNRRNRVNNGTGGPAQIYVRSSSHTAQELMAVIAALKSRKIWSLVLDPVASPDAIIEPDSESLTHARDMSQAMWVKREWDSFRWTPPVADIPHIEPGHLDDVPGRQAFARGVWCLDVSFQYEEERPRVSQTNRWYLPARLHMADAFFVHREDQQFPSYIAPWNRRSKGGHLAVFTSREQTVARIRVPTIEEALNCALCMSRYSDQARTEQHWPRSLFFQSMDSNEAQYLKGVVGMTGGFSERNLILHPFLRGVFASLGGNPRLSKKDSLRTFDTLNKRRRSKPRFDLTDESDLEALGIWIVKAAQNLKRPRTAISLNELDAIWEKHRKIYWDSRTRLDAPNTDDEIDWDGVEQATLHLCLATLRRLRMVFQGYPWTCEVCLHKNWVDFQALSPEIECDICRSRAALPVGIPWHFRPNEFLIQSLQQHSVLSLLWVLSALHQRSMYAFAFRGPCALKNGPASVHVDHEIDLFALVDGKVYMCEVKTSWQGVRTSDLQDFVEMAKRIRPDVALFAVMEEGSKLSKEIETSRRELAAQGIELELLVPSRYEVSDYPRLPY